jgi:hypothetical protein
MFPAIWDLKKNLTLVPVTVTEESLNFSAGPFELLLKINRATAHKYGIYLIVNEK